MRFNLLFVLASTVTVGACSTVAQDGGNTTANGTTGFSASGSGTDSGVGETGTPATTATATAATTSGTADPTGTTDSLTSGPPDATTGTSLETTTEPTSDTEGPGTTTGGTGMDTTGTDTTEGSSTTGGMGGGPCEVDADCKLSTDCCECYGLPVGEDEQPVCDMVCLQSKCSELGIDEAVCRFGQCTTEKLDCSSEVACDARPPACPPGTLPGIGDGCWTGGCVPAAACDKVPDCALCPESTMCVELQAWVTDRTCEPIPAECDGEPDCDCASAACVDPFDVCQEGMGEADLACVCITC